MTDDQQPITALTWGLKESFCRYVEGAQGVIEVGGGALRAPEGDFVFPAAAGSSLAFGAGGTLSGRGLFSGEVRFEAHGGMLSVLIADPAIEFISDGLVLTAFYSADRARRVDLAELDLSVPGFKSATEVAIECSITANGSYLLGGNYPVMTPLDPVRLKLPEA